MIQKEALSLTPENFKKLVSAITKNPVRTAGTVALGTMVAGGVSKALKVAVDKLITDPKRKRTLESLMREDPILRDADPAKVLEYYSVIYSIAPSLTLNKGALRDPLVTFIKFGKVDLSTIKTLSEIEEKLVRTKTTKQDKELAFISGGISLLGTAAKSSAELAKIDSGIATQLSKNASAPTAFYKHLKNKERIVKAIDALDYFKEQGVF